MVFPFGVSVGDFIAGLQLTYDSVRALGEAHGASSDYRSLATTLESLISALCEIEILQCHTSQMSKRLMVQKETESCRTLINEFLSRIDKFAVLSQPAQSSWTVDGLKSVARKLQWSLLKKDEVSRFRREISSRVDSIQMMLLTFQMCADFGISYVRWSWSNQGTDQPTNFKSSASSHESNPPRSARSRHSSRGLFIVIAC
jgi:hypothetical protein